MDSQTLINLLLAGITLGAVYVLMTIGLNLIYGVTKIFNYAQGSFFGWAGYVAWYLSVGQMRWNYGLVIGITIVTLFAFGVLFERTIIRPVRRRPGWDLTVLIVTLGSALLLDNLTLVLFNPLQKTIPSLMEGTLRFGTFAMAKHDIVALGVGIAVLGGLAWFLANTRLGMGLRAVSQDQTGAMIVGLSVDNLYSLSFGIAAALSAVAAILLIPRTLLYPSVGWVILMKAFVIIVLGGLGSIKGTAVAAFVLATMEIVVSYFLGGIWALSIFLTLLVVILVFRPKGLFGTW